MRTAVGLTSAAALGYEILLIRLFGIVEWHHLAFLVISLALFGYGASGTLIAVARERMLPRFNALAAMGAAGFGATSIGAFFCAQRMELNALEIFWSTSQLGKLFALYLLFAIPFFCAATAIGLALTRFGAESPRIYRADLLGGGLSAAVVTGLLFVVHPVTALQIIASLGFVAAALFARGAGVPPACDGHPARRHRGPAGCRAVAGGTPAPLALAIAGIIAVIAARPLLLPLRISQFKDLRHALRVPGAHIVDKRSSPLAMLTTVASPAVPFRHAPGLSLAFAGTIPPQLGVFSDGGGMTPILLGDPSYLDALPTAVPYHLGRRRERVAVIGAGGGTEVVSALTHGAREVTAVELNAQMVALVRRWSDVYGDPRVRVVTAEARQFIRDSDTRYDAIQIALVGSHGASAAGMQAVTESTLYTVEAMRELVEHLRPGGVLVITRWMQVPPREMVKLLATAVVSQEKPATRIALLRGWNTATLIVRNGDFTDEEIAALRRFCDERSFDLEYAPGVRREETNQYNVLDEPFLFDAATTLLAGERSREDFYARSKFNVRPATDERPYFFHSLRWRALPELLRLRTRGGMPLLEWGYLVLVLALAQALVAATLFILLPLFFLRRAEARRSTLQLIVYFGAIGLGFLFIEIAFMQRLTFFLGHPLYAIAVVLSSFLVFGGLGSGAAARVSERHERFVPLLVAALALIGLLLARALTAAALGLPDAAKILISVALVAPLAFVMGMPFPLGLRRLATIDPSAIPWAWGVNGTASVLSSMIATLIAVHFGFSVLVALAALLYALAWLPWGEGLSPSPRA